MKARLPGGLTMAYDESGTGTPLLFLHGWPHSRQLWAGQMGGLAHHARCIAPDLRGFGASSVSGPYSMDQYADDVAAFLASLKIDGAVVCGLSMGGYVALALLHRHRRLLRGLILCDTRATADDDEGRGKRLRLAGFIQERGMEALAELQLPSQVSPETLANRPDSSDALRRLMASTPAAGAIGAQHAMAARTDSTPLLATIDVPTLVVGGADDAITPPDELRGLAAALPGARLEIISGTGHLAPYERPAAFNHIVAEFMQRLGDL